ncbi:MAG TPA: UDP-N-acetylmuramate dehydrogenase [Candidatus Paceibacterota bacterium]
MKILSDISLAPYTTLRIGGPARYFIEVHNEQELYEGLAFAKARPSGELPVFILGGGSNVLFADSGFDGLVVRPLFKGLEISEVGPHFVRIRVGAGEILDDMIAWTVENNWWGLENLSFIPGLVGALAIQNVGAYGAEASEVIESVEVFDMLNGKSQMVNREECRFGYRQSRFNTYDKGRFVILHVNLRLNKNGKANLAYRDVCEHFNSLGGLNPGLSEIRDAIIKIRKSKGQDPSEVWSAGSFFKNFIVEDNDGTQYKILIGEILDKRLGLKGLRLGGAKLSEKQVLNMINTGNATAKDCIDLFNKVRDIVRDKTGLELVNEPEFVGF